ncbi:MAG: hypothetical protein K8L97_29325 [Anaerolineae bacterium]|nr:hypothetical protein [Anaerolineae bacterium]
MTRLNPTPEIIESILTRVPEGFIRYDTLCQRVKLDRNIRDTLVNGKIAYDGDWWYDTTRLTLEQAREYRRWARPIFPEMDAKGVFAEIPIPERIAQREVRVYESGDPSSARQVLTALNAALGYAKPDDLCITPDDRKALNYLLDVGELRKFDGLIFDPLHVGSKTMRHLAAQHRLAPAREQLVELLESLPGCAAPQADLIIRFGSPVMNELLGTGEFKLFQIPGTRKGQTLGWVRLASADPQIAQQVANENVMNSWDKLLTVCGDLIRPGARDGKKARMKVIARTYTVSNAAKRIGVRQRTLEQAITEGRIEAFDDPEGVTRLPADAVEAAFSNPEYAEHITAYETLTTRDISIVVEMSYSTVRRRLQKAGFSRNDPRWGQVRGRWNLPDTYHEFRAILKQKLDEWHTQRETESAEQRREIEEQRRIQSEMHDELRARLVASFPTWQNDGRIDQRIYLRVGPPNSGKTHRALEALVAAGSGWYLAPLRLLAFEIFDRLNTQGVRCNLLTGEEFIPVDGATFTAATVEMFNPGQSGECVVIDEAQMLADPDRGWAWTRALMEAESPEIHVLGPATAQELIERMASSAAIPLEIVEHDRLGPIQIADHHWPLPEIPQRTILVAFSRAMVLSLKTELEKMKRRVSVVYGNLPPEVRRKQAERFATGETDVCVATDAVGMGLNLPADYVCFYEVEKYDGRTTRPLTPAEVQQIGGRAGRFGLSTIGEIGATNKHDLKFLRKVYYEAAQSLTHARVAPTVADLEMIPGTLADKLRQWSLLQSIPESLRGAIKTADMAERIELAQMLTDREVKLLGLEAALKLVNAPARVSSRPYWYRCARAILTDKEMPLPPVAPREITNTIELESIELSVACSDIYLWLANRREFKSFGQHEPEVREMRGEWSMQIDGALLRRINTARRCARCGVPLPLKHRYSICNNCYYGNGRDDDWR